MFRLRKGSKKCLKPDQLYLCCTSNILIKTNQKYGRKGLFQTTVSTNHRQFHSLFKKENGTRIYKIYSFCTLMQNNNPLCNLHLVYKFNVWSGHGFNQVNWRPGDQYHRECHSVVLLVRLFRKRLRFQPTFCRTNSTFE